jgi:hypothetical protein
MGSLGSFCVIGLGWAACVLLQAAFQGTQPWLTAPAGAVLLAADVVWVLRRHRRQANADWDVVRRQCGFSRKAVRAARRAALDPEAVMLHALSSPPEWRAVIQEQLLDLARSRHRSDRGLPRAAVQGDATEPPEEVGGGIAAG